MRLAFSNRRGFTLVELLVVAAVVVTTAALAPSAIQRAREAARRSSCKNNLKQIAIAIHNYHDAHRSFPPGWIAHRLAPGNGPRFGWQASILPYMDFARLYEQLDFEKPLPAADALTDSAGRKTLQRHISAYRCPSDPTSIANPMRGDYGTSNYSGNYGDLPVPRWTTGRRTAFWPGQIDTPRRTNGIMYANSNIKFRDITDGSSNTLMAGERSVSSGSGIWPGVGSNEFENDVASDCSHASRLNGGPTSFSSAHPDGAHFVLCDGSVRFIDNGVDSQPVTMGELGTYQRLANRHDGLIVGEEF